MSFCFQQPEGDSGEIVEARTYVSEKANDSAFIAPKIQHARQGIENVIGRAAAPGTHIDECLLQMGGVRRVRNVYRGSQGIACRILEELEKHFVTISFAR